MLLCFLLCILEGALVKFSVVLTPGIRNLEVEVLLYASLSGQTVS